MTDKSGTCVIFGYIHTHRALMLDSELLLKSDFFVWLFRLHVQNLTCLQTAKWPACFLDINTVYGKQTWWQPLKLVSAILLSSMFIIVIVVTPVPTSTFVSVAELWTVAFKKIPYVSDSGPQLEVAAGSGWACWETRLRSGGFLVQAPVWTTA